MSGVFFTADGDCLSEVALLWFPISVPGLPIALVDQ